MAFDNELSDINWSEPFEMAAPTTENSIPADCIQCLQKSFGHSSFREMQWKIISSILDGARDNCVIMATGYGKSLCYQFPSVYRDTISIVVSPLISLMQDQVLAMRFYKLRACFLGSAQMERETTTKVIDHQYNIVYVTPEYITSDSGKYLIERIRDNLTLIAIDEAHCISKWGHEFRQAYRNLNCLRSLCPSVPILAMTATATEQVRDDIIKSLKLRNAQIVATGFDRPNLEFIVKRKNKVWTDIGPSIQNIKIGSVIVYCISRRNTEEVASVLSLQGLLVGVYHAGMTLKKRQQTHDDFIHDRIRVVVATIAFGMGINKPDVRLVVHYGVAKDVESYYQEVGRAGRDGLPAQCLMFHSPKDWQLHQFIREKSTLKSAHEQMEKLLLAMSKYVNTPDCRRRYILNYFGEDCDKLETRPDCCDNCRLSVLANTKPINLFQKYHGLDENGLLDITDESFKLLSLIRDMAAQFGLSKAILILRGSKSKSLPITYNHHALFGKLKDKPEKWIQAVGKSLLDLKMLAMIKLSAPINKRSFAHPRCVVTSKGKVWLSGITAKTPIKVIPGEEFIKLLKPKIVGTPKTLVHQIETPSENLPSTSASVSSNSLPPAIASSTFESIFRPLLKVRSKLAGLYDVMPYLVASTRALQQLAIEQPTTMEELRKIALDGYSEEKTERFGPVFLKVIKDYHAKYGMAPLVMREGTLSEENAHNQIAKSEPMVEASTNHPSSNANEGITVISDDDDEQLNNEQQCNSKLQNDAEPLNGIISENGDANEYLDLTQNSVEIIERTPPPLIEIESDRENEESFVYWESDDDVWGRDQACIKNENQPNGMHLPSCSPSNDLDLLIDAVKSEDLHTKQENRKKTRVIKRNPSTEFEFEDGTGSDLDIFEGNWDLDIDESDLTQISEQAEQQFKNESLILSAHERTPADAQPIDLTNAGKSELDLFIDAVKMDSNNTNSHGERKSRIIERRLSDVFQYEDDSESDTDTKNVVSPKKRILPSWMQLSNKRRR